jgi:hypothetical protein
MGLSVSNLSVAACGGRVDAAGAPPPSDVAADKVDAVGGEARAAEAEAAQPAPAGGAEKRPAPASPTASPRAKSPRKEDASPPRAASPGAQARPSSSPLLPLAPASPPSAPAAAATVVVSGAAAALVAPAAEEPEVEAVALPRVNSRRTNDDELDLEVVKELPDIGAAPAPAPAPSLLPAARVTPREEAIEQEEEEQKRPEPSPRLPSPPRTPPRSPPRSPTKTAPPVVDLARLAPAAAHDADAEDTDESDAEDAAGAAGASVAASSTSSSGAAGGDATLDDEAIARALAAEQETPLQTPYASLLDLGDPWPTTPAPPSPRVETPRSKRRRMRLAVARELLTTEQSYLKSLETVQEVFIRPLRDALAGGGDALLEEADVAVVFSYLESLLPLNRKFLADVHARLFPRTAPPSSARGPAVVEDESAAAAAAAAAVVDDELEELAGVAPEAAARARNGDVGDLLLAFAPYFKLYSAYVQNHEKAMTFLTRTMPASRRYDRAREFFALCEKDARCRGQSLQSFLILPIQRIPRYKLLIEQLLKYTDEEENATDATNLRNALDLIQRVAAHINEAMNEQQRNFEVLAVQDQFIGNTPSLVAPGRRFLRQGLLVKVGRKANQRYAFFLFNDLVVYADPPLIGKRGFRERNRVEINDAFDVNDVAEDEAIGTLTPEQARLAFRISTFQKSFYVLCPDATSKEQWLSALRKAIDERRNSKIVRPVTDSQAQWKAAPVMEQFTEKSACWVCGLGVTVLTRRHCKACGHVVHDACSETRLILPGTHDKREKRVCDTCARRIRDERTRELRGSMAPPPLPERPVEHLRRSSTGLPLPPRPGRPQTISIQEAVRLTAQMEQMRALPSPPAADFAAAGDALAEPQQPAQEVSQPPQQPAEPEPQQQLAEPELQQQPEPQPEPQQQQPEPQQQQPELQQQPEPQPEPQQQQPEPQQQQPEPQQQQPEPQEQQPEPQQPEPQQPEPQPEPQQPEPQPEPQPPHEQQPAEPHPHQQQPEPEMQPQPQPQAEAPAEAAALPDGWSAHRDGEGNEFFAHANGNTQWERPVATAAAAPAAPPPRPPRPTPRTVVSALQRLSDADTRVDVAAPAPAPSPDAAEADPAPHGRVAELARRFSQEPVMAGAAFSPPRERALSPDASATRPHNFDASVAPKRPPAALVAELSRRLSQT